MNADLRYQSLKTSKLKDAELKKGQTTL